MLEWADQTMEITTIAIDLEFLPTDSNEGRGVHNLEFILQHMHETLMTLTSQEANDIVANSRMNPLEALRRQEERYDPTAGGRNRNILRTSISPGRCSLQELQAGIERWETCVARYEKLKGKMDDETQRAGLESLVPEELGNHLIFNFTRLRTFEDVRSEIVTYVKVKFGFRIRDSKPSEAGFCERSDPTDVGVVSIGCFKDDAAHFQRGCSASKNMGKQTSGKGNQSKSWSTTSFISGKLKGQENHGQSKGLSRGTKSDNKSAKGKTSEVGTG